MADPIGVFFTNPPAKKPTAWQKINAYIRCIILWLALLAALRLLSVVVEWFT